MELKRYLVELERPPDGWTRLQQATAGARETAAAMRAEGVPVRFLRSIFVPEDDVCFFLFEAPSRLVVQDAVERSLGAVSGVSQADRLHAHTIRTRRRKADAQT